MRAAFVSDAHLTALDDPAQRDLVTWMDGLEVDALYILGDLFHHWWGYADVIWAPYVPVCAALHRLSRRGVAITMVAGNHDFALGSFLRDAVGILEEPAHRARLDGPRLFLAHGDEADRSPAYARARRLLRGQPFAGLMRLLGPARGHALIRRLAHESRLRPEHQARLLDQQVNWARERLREGADAVLMGHAHHPLIRRDAAGLIVHLGDWSSRRSWAKLDGEHLRLWADGALQDEVELRRGA